MDLLIRHEPNVDYAETAALAAEGFETAPGSFSADRMRWLYERAFSLGTTVLSAYSGDRKVGQVALIHQEVRLDGTAEKAVQLVDLFILKAFRSSKAIRALYGEVERFCRANGIRFILGVPNPSGARVNARYLKMAPCMTLEMRAGLALPLRLRKTTMSADLRRLGGNELRGLFSRFLPRQDAGMTWTADRLCERFMEKSASFGVHATDDLLLVSSPRTSRSVPHVLLCAFMARPGETVRVADVKAVTAAACALHRRPIYIYAGINHAIPLPGRPLPERIRPSPMEVQIRDFAEPKMPVAFDRFDMIDFDFA